MMRHIRHTLKCEDCDEDFIAKRINAKRCLKCRNRHRIEIYWRIPSVRKRINAQNRERYRNNPSVREQIKKASKQRYLKNFQPAKRACAICGKIFPASFWTGERWNGTPTKTCGNKCRRELRARQARATRAKNKTK